MGSLGLVFDATDVLGGPRAKVRHFQLASCSLGVDGMLIYFNFSVSSSSHKIARYLL